MKKRFKSLGIIALLLIIAMVAWRFIFKPEKTAVTLQTSKVELGSVAKKVTATGTLQPVDTVAVGTQVSGTIAAVYADFNGTVKKGQLLAELDRSLLSANVNQISGTVTQAQSALAYQQNNFSRQKQLYQLGAISKADYDIAVNQYNAAGAALQSAQAQLQSAQKNLSFTRIYSPIDGVVLSRNVNVGQTVAASFSTPTLFSIARDITKMQVQAAVDEADIGNVKVGQRASFKVDAFVDKEFQGTVEEIRLSPTTSSNVVTYTTLISADNSLQELKPGMTATITIYTEEANNVPVVPVAALKFHPDSSLQKQYRLIKSSETGKGSAYVWIEQGKQLIQKKITTGIDDNTEVQVISGIQPGDMVVTGSSGGNAKTATAAASSPFMPKRPGGSNKNNQGSPR